MRTWRVVAFRRGFLLFDNMVGGGGDVLGIRCLVVGVVGSGRGKWGADDDS